MKTLLQFLVDLYVSRRFENDHAANVFENFRTVHT